jgi:superfamily II DNA helicase RecQ
MKVRVVTLRFVPEQGGFDDAELRAFMESAEVLDVTHHFFVQEQSPWMVLVLRYRESEARARLMHGRGEPAGDRAPTDHASTLDPAQRGLYDALRAWRHARAKADGLPPYVVLTNRQLAVVARLGPRTKAALEAVEGFGERKRDSYADDVLRVVAEASVVPAPVELVS